jgi:hypothetical protein
MTDSWARASLGAALLGVLATGCQNGPDVRGPFRGEIVDADTGRPIAGAVVVAVWTHLMNYFQGGRREVDAREVVTDSEGRWEIGERPTPIWEGGIAGVRRKFYVFAAGYEVVDRRGTPSDEYEPRRESTTTTMRRLKTREERCRSLPYLMPSVDNNMSRIPRYLAAWETELQTQCQGKDK